MKNTLYLLLALSGAAHGQPSDDSAPLERATGCMLRVLAATPGVTESKLGEATKDGVTLPFLEYRAREQSRWVQPTRFTLHDSNGGHFTFSAHLPGIGPLDTHVTDAIVGRWKAQCGVSAVVILG